MNALCPVDAQMAGQHVAHSLVPLALREAVVVG